MMKFCYLYVTNDDIFAKYSFDLICNVEFAIFIISTLENIIYFIICNVLFAKFIKTPNFCTLHVLCAILFFAHLEMYVQFCYVYCNFLHTSFTVCNFVFAH